MTMKLMNLQIIQQIINDLQIIQQIINDLQIIQQIINDLQIIQQTTCQRKKEKLILNNKSLMTYAIRNPSIPNDLRQRDMQTHNRKGEKEERKTTNIHTWSSSLSQELLFCMAFPEAKVLLFINIIFINENLHQLSFFPHTSIAYPCIK
jgi:hypothetical protein